MAYVQSKVMKKRLQDKRRISGAALLREELNNDGDSSSLLDGLPAFQQNKGVMMANFEEWIKMATDNKINSTNSWNFALIDYFHDLNVLRENDNNINFQKASATLDGCVKIYSSRVDSVATETGRLLSGLATRKKDHTQGEDHDEEEDDDKEKEADQKDGDGDDQFKDDDVSLAKKKKMQAKTKYRELGDTLVTFDSIRVKKLSLELAIDPLFKKTLAEFDEGGAKSLLLNTLHMDRTSRVVFDASTTNANGEDDIEPVEEDVDAAQDEDVEMSGLDEDLDISEFKSYLFNDDDDLDKLVVCPSFGHLESVLKDINKAKSILNDVNQQNNDIPDFTKTMKDSDDEPVGFDFDFGADSGNNSYGELDNEAAAVIFNDELDPHHEEVVGNETGVVASVVDQDLMAYFDNTLKRTWAGPDHWKIKQLKKDKQHEVRAASGAPTKKAKESFTIDFLNEVDEEEEEQKIFNKGKTTTTLPQEQWESKDTNLLPDDLYFSSEQLTKLFLKPTQKLNIFRRKINVRSTTASEEAEDRREADATFWAANYEEQEKSKAEENGDYDEDPGFDYDLGDDGFADFAFAPGDNDAEEKVNFGTQLITGGAKVKPEYVNYSKKAKNVNIKVLKDNLWNVLETETHKQVIAKEEASETQFSTIVKDIGDLYPKEQKKELSTSFCFICLLHLANEHSLTLENNDSLTDLKITNPN